MTILDKLQRAGSRRGTHPAITVGPRRFTFSDLEGGSNAAARVLRAQGVKQGHRVALFADKGLEWILAYFGALKVGAIALPINPTYTERELTHCLNDAKPSAIIVDPETRELAMTCAPPSVRAFMECSAEEAERSEDRRVHPFYQAVRKASVQPVDELIWDKDDALLLYTSGTTGAPKGAVLTHANLQANAEAIVTAFGWSEDDRLVHALPLFHVHGLCLGIHGTIIAGSETILLPRFDADAVLTTLRERGATLFMGVPTMYSRMVDAAMSSPVSLPKMRLFVSGSAPLSDSTFKAFKEQFGHEILERYGMTETLITLCQPLDAPRAIGTVGVPVTGIEARVETAGESEGEGEGDSGSPGELWVRGTSVGPRYWNNPTATKESRSDGWFKTGDLAEQDGTDGPFRIVGRAKDLILTGGYNVYPREIEDVLSEHPAVAEACVFGQPDADLGEVVHAAIVTGPDSTRTGDDLISELIEHCRDRVAPYKLPRAVRLVDELPKNAMGKVVRDDLRREPSAG